MLRHPQNDRRDGCGAAQVVHEEVVVVVRIRLVGTFREVEGIPTVLGTCGQCVERHGVEGVRVQCRTPVPSASSRSPLLHAM